MVADVSTASCSGGRHTRSRTCSRGWSVRFYGDDAPLPNREQVVADYADYVDRMLQQGHRLQGMLRHVHGLYAGLAERASLAPLPERKRPPPGAGADVLRQSLRMFERAA